MAAIDYWEQRYSEEGAFGHHSTQNKMIANDFLLIAKTKPAFTEALWSREIIEIGCGTGDLAFQIKSEFDTGVYYATDFSRKVIDHANGSGDVNFWVFDVLNDTPPKQFDLAIASNTLEHFTDPFTVIEKMFALAPTLILIVPFCQPVTDGYDGEGGGGHVFEFNSTSFLNYRVTDSFIFRSKGWVHSSMGETPLQLAVLLNA